MTIADFLRVVLSRWYVILAGALLTFASCWALVVEAPPAYYSRMEIRFVEAGPGAREGILTSGSERIVPFVAAVERVVNDGQPVISFNSRDSAIRGIGVRQGTRVAMPNYGTQWTSSYPVPTLVLEVVDESPAGVVAAHTKALTEIRGTVQALQDQQRVPAEARVSVVEAASKPSVAFVGAPRGEKLRAMVAAIFVGAGFTAVVAFEWDRRALRRSLRRKAQGQSTASRRSRPDPL